VKLEADGARYRSAVWRRGHPLRVERRAASTRPDGWQPPDLFLVRGRVPPGEFEFERPGWGRPGDERSQGHYRFESVTASGARFRLDEISLFVSASRFRECAFRQERRGPIGGHTEADGSFGHGVRSTYQECLFDHVDFGQRGGGFSPGDARFERCTFRFCNWRWLMADRADFVDCAFEGLMKRAWFYGVDPEDPDRVNEFARNDFTRAKLRGVEFRAGLDLTDTKLPTGPEYLRLDELRSRIAGAREAIETWPEAERRHAEIVLAIFEEEGIDTLFAWRGSLPQPDSRLWQLLEHSFRRPTRQSR
jgi:hypothetical protein